MGKSTGHLSPSHTSPVLWDDLGLSPADGTLPRLPSTCSDAEKLRADLQGGGALMLGAAKATGPSPTPPGTQTSTDENRGYSAPAEGPRTVLCPAPPHQCSTPTPQLRDGETESHSPPNTTGSFFPQGQRSCAGHPVPGILRGHGQGCHHHSFTPQVWLLQTIKYSRVTVAGPLSGKTSSLRHLELLATPARATQAQHRHRRQRLNHADHALSPKAAGVTHGRLSRD